VNQPTGPAENPAPATSTERWVYGGIRVLNGKRVHAWIDPHGHELLYSHKRSGHWAIGRYYTADVIRTGTRTQLYGTPMYTGDRDAGDELRRQLWVKDTAARTRLADLAAERKAAQRNAIDEALQPLLAAASVLRTGADRDAFIAYVLRRLISGWSTP
jgi:hypothetical protein